MMPYHLFVYEGRPFVYHLGLGKCLSVSPDAYELLTLRQTMSKEEATKAFLAKRPDDEAVVRETETLEDCGFFEPAETGFETDDEQFEQALARRYEKDPWSHLELSLSERCNLACRYCYCGTCRDELPNNGLMPWETAKRAIDWLFARCRGQDVSITFFGGEPLLNKDVLKRAVAYSQELASAKGVQTTFVTTTNATLMDDETAELIAKNNFGLMVSLDGPQNLHDAQCPTRDGSGSWDLAVAGIRRLMKVRKRVTVRCTMAHPVPDMLKLVRFFTDFGFTRIVLGSVENPQFPSACDFTDEDRASEERQLTEKVVPWMLSELAAGRKPVYDPFADIEEAFKSAEPPTPSFFHCGACRGNMTVGADGALFPCHRFVGLRDWTLGSVEKGPDLDRCRKFWRDYLACVKEHCAGCWAYRLCGGPCPWRIARADGTFAMDPSVCEDAKRRICQGAWYLELKKDQENKHQRKGEIRK